MRQDAQASNAGSPRAGVGPLIHNQAHALAVVARDDLVFDNLRNAATRFLNRIRCNKTHGFRLALEELYRRRRLVGRTDAIGGGWQKTCELLLENSLRANHAPVPHQLGVGAVHRDEADTHCRENADRDQRHQRDRDQ